MPNYALAEQVSFNDPDIKVTFETILKLPGVDYQAFIYPGVNHGFHNDSTGRYNRQDAELAWGRTLGFFNQHLS